MNYRLAYLQQISPKDIALVIQESIKQDSTNQHQAAVLQAALEAHLNQRNKLSNNRDSVSIKRNKI